MIVGVGSFIVVHEESRPLVVRPRAALAERPEVAVLAGHAPDGLPLVLHVERRASVVIPVCSSLRKRREDLPREIAGALDRLEEEVQRHARAEGIAAILGEPIYVTEARIEALLGDTLLVRALGAASPLVLPEDALERSPERVANTSVVALAAEPAELLAKIHATSHLGIRLTEGPPLVVAEDLQRARPLVLEDLRRLPETRLHWRGEAGEEQWVEVADEEGYARALREARRMAWSASRQDLAGIVVALARSLAVLHRRGLVHADVKPANTLVSGAAVVAHDPIAVKAGERSPAATPGWSAPEQVLARPVSGATDVFALGLLAARVADAAIYGEERSFVVPTGGAERRRLRVLADPEVFLDPTHVQVDESGRAAWQGLLARAVAFDPAARFADGAAFADALAEVVRRHPLPGRVGLRAGPGRLVRNAELLGRAAPCWVLSDRR